MLCRSRAFLTVPKNYEILGRRPIENLEMELTSQRCSIIIEAGASPERWLEQRSIRWHWNYQHHPWSSDIGTVLEVFSFSEQRCWSRWFGIQFLWGMWVPWTSRTETQFVPSETKWNCQTHALCNQWWLRGKIALSTILSAEKPKICRTGLWSIYPIHSGHIGCHNGITSKFPWITERSWLANHLGWLDVGKSH